MEDSPRTSRNRDGGSLIAAREAIPISSFDYFTVHFGLGEAKAKAYTHSGVGERRMCVVSFRDREGVEHVAEVTAESLFEAAALGLNQFEICHLID